MIHVKWLKYTLKFKFKAGTSRGILRDKTSYFIFIRSKHNKIGIGECSPLKGLSIDDRPDFEKYLARVCKEMAQYPEPTLETLRSFIDHIISTDWPSIRMGFETAWRDFINNGNRVIFKNKFLSGEKIPINGLIWMGNRDFMEQQIRQKIKEGYSCFKMKIGAIDFQTELEILQFIRDHTKEKQITIRVDANGSFSPEEALRNLEKLSQLNIHSIEQPLKQGQWKHTEFLCREKIVPIALDEELIGIHGQIKKIHLLELLKPQYIVLKPSLLGGFFETAEWISLAEERNIGWWITSALESNIGLNALVQFTMENRILMEQGLGTGQLYHNNFSSPLNVKNGYIFYSPDRLWNLTPLGV